MKSIFNSINIVGRILMASAWLVMMILGGLNLSAQSNVVTEIAAGEEVSFSNPVDSIEYLANGNIEFEISPDLMESILQRPEGRRITRTISRPTVKHTGTLQKIKGYRIQVFSDGRNQAQLEGQARQRGNAIAAKFPKYRGQIYTYSQAPNWITRVGNFQTTSEAQAALSELKSAFPRFAGEMRIVNTQIYVLK